MQGRDAVTLRGVRSDPAAGSYLGRGSHPPTNTTSSSSHASRGFRSPRGTRRGLKAKKGKEGCRNGKVSCCCCCCCCCCCSDGEVRGIAGVSVAPVAAMELREMSSVATAEETAELLPNQADEDNDDESYFIDYAIQKEIINRNRSTASRRLLSHVANYPDLNAANSNPRQKDLPCISFIHTSGPNWPPSRKREEAKALENLRKRVEQSKLFKANQISDPGGPTISTQLNDEQLQQLDNRPKLLKKILSNRPMSIAHDSSDLETDWRDSEFITECLCWHNVYRQRHNAPPLTMSPELCEYAQTWANHLAHTNTFYYRNDREVGQNLYCRPGGAVPGDVTGQDVAAYWYSAVRQYDFLKEPDVLHANVNAGHFTQLIWASSRGFGVGKARSRSGKIIVVANYQPVGNVSGQFQRNVLPPLPDCGNLPLPPPPRVRQYEEPPLSDMSTSSNSSISTQ